jgi:hypothetical protein
MDSVFRWIESSALSVWTRESTSLIAYPAILSAPAIGMALAAGINAAIALRLLDAASEIPAAEMRRFAGVAWIGLAIHAVSGMLLLIAYPTKALTNPGLFIAASGVNALTFYLTTYRTVTANGAPVGAPPAAKAMAAVSLSLWIGVIVAGRLLTFYRPFPCQPPEPGFVATCIPGFHANWK